MMQYCGDFPLPDQLQVVPGQVVRDKHLAGTPDGFECFQNGFVPTADGIDRGDIRPVLQNINGLVPNCGVNAVGIGRFDQFAAGRELPERRPEADFALFFATKSAAAEGQQHGPGAAAHRAAVRYGVQGLDQFGRPRLFPEIEPRSDERGPQHRQRQLQGGFDGCGEPVRRLHDDVNDEGSAIHP